MASLLKLFISLNSNFPHGVLEKSSHKILMCGLSLTLSCPAGQNLGASNLNQSLPLQHGQSQEFSGRIHGECHGLYRSISLLLRNDLAFVVIFTGISFIFCGGQICDARPHRSCKLILIPTITSRSCTTSVQHQPAFKACACCAAFPSGAENHSEPKAGVAGWPAAGQLHHQNYGSSFDNLFMPEAAGVRYGVPQTQENFPKHHPSSAVVGQSAPYLTVQCGKFTAPVQREARHLQQDGPQHSMAAWNQHGSRHSFDAPPPSKV